MFTDFLGAKLNLTQLANNQSVYQLKIITDDEQTLELYNCTWSGIVSDLANEQTYAIACQASMTDSSTVVAIFPAMPVGNYQYVIAMTDDSGRRHQMITGNLLIVASLMTHSSNSSSSSSSSRMLDVRLPVGIGRHVTLSWHASTAAQSAAQQAVDCLQTIQQQHVSITDMLAQTNSTIGTAAALLGDCQQFRSDWESDLNNAVRIDANGIWWIGGICTGQLSRGADGHSPFIDTNGHWTYWSDADQAWQDGGVANGADGRDGDQVAVHVYPTIDLAPADGSATRVYCPYTVDGVQYYAVYQWVTWHGIDGSGEKNEWRQIGTTQGTHNTIATADSYGLVQLSTDGTTDAHCVGINDDGTLGVMWATLTQPGVVRLGSKFKQSNPLPYIVGVGVDDDNKLTNNLLYSGAIRHQSPTAWQSTGMTWLAEAMSNTPQWFSDAYYLGLSTSNQLTQVGGMLAVNDATANISGAVYMATGWTDARQTAVPSARQVADALALMYSATEVNALIEQIKNEYETKLASLQADIQAWVLAQGYDTAQSVDTKLASYVKTTETVTAIEAMTTDEFNNLDKRDDTTLYLN